MTYSVRLSLICSIKDQTGLGREMGEVWTHAMGMCGSDMHVEIFFDSTEQVLPFVIFTFSAGSVSTCFFLTWIVCIHFKAVLFFTDDMPYFTEQKAGPECITQNTEKLCFLANACSLVEQSAVQRKHALLFKWRLKDVEALQ